MVRFTKYLYQVLWQPGKLLDAYLSAQLIALGFWFAEPGWAVSRTPKVIHTMAGFIPIGAWAMLFCVVGLVGLLGVIADWRNVRITCRFAGVWCWGVVAYYFVVLSTPTPPPPIGLIAPISAITCFARSIQIGAGNGHSA